MAKAKTQAWTTEDELKFLAKLGTYNEQTAKLGRPELLKRYAAAIRRRMNWGAVDAMRIMQEVRA